MIRITFTFCVRECLCEDCNEATPHGRVKVRGHFRVVNGKKVYVRMHYRKK